MEPMTAAQRAEIEARLDELMDEIRDLSRRLDAVTGGLSPERSLNSAHPRFQPPDLLGCPDGCGGGFAGVDVASGDVPLVAMGLAHFH
jgi:hypothetical protein